MTEGMKRHIMDIVRDETEDYFVKMDLAEQADDPLLCKIMRCAAKDEESHARYLAEYMQHHGHAIPDDIMSRYDEMERHLWS